ncbi:MAG: ECF-type sigma factor [Planctomycetaceae bacterium]
MISSQDSVSSLCHRVGAGDADAAFRLWQEFFNRLVELAGRRLTGTSTAAADEEDVALSAFKSFCLGMRKGRFATLTDRDSLWRLLVVITARKAVDHVEHNRRMKRDELRVVRPQSTEANDELVNGFVCQRPTPSIELEMRDDVNRALAALELPELKRIAVLKLDGYTNQEIADQLERGLSTIERKLRTIRGIWSQLG